MGNFTLRQLRSFLSGPREVTLDSHIFFIVLLNNIFTETPSHVDRRVFLSFFVVFFFFL